MKPRTLIELGGDDGVARVVVGGPQVVLIAGPCVIESEAQVLETARALKTLSASAGLPFIFKASFDKANRTALHAHRGPGLFAGLQVLSTVRSDLGVPVTTDIHTVEQAEAVAGVVDLIQIPAFLCRQTDLLLAAGRTGRPVNIKKGQFVAPSDMRFAAEKVSSTGGAGVMLTERGTTFGHNDLVVDFRGLVEMASLGVPVCFDATHSCQKPGASAQGTGGVRAMAPVLARAAVAVGVDAVFFEVHPDPERALSDAATQQRIADMGAILSDLAALDAVSRRHSGAS